MPDPVPHLLEQRSAAGPWDGPSYRDRGADIHCLPGGHVCGLTMPNHPINGATFGVPGTITPIVDLWVDEQRLPQHIRQQARP
jgi:hypothetical protein